ncbi:agmatinase [Rhizoctonia solani AG-1 IB]|uniref:Agmatinase n=1 Tax=Thanatephorus cucumeris (strain AG1-IB / isolate 7/3/14) TaxID=1108050 RepID=M5BWR6_THACB|nr:agmatinase [Rhizoctonia solani AG-1 IB]
MRLTTCALLAITFTDAQAHLGHNENSQSPLGSGEGFKTWADKYGSQFDMSFSGPLSFAHLPYTKCLEAENERHLFDIAILGMPFDSAVSYRPGARFGPYGIRSGSRRISPTRGYTTAWGYNPYKQDMVIQDCGDVPIVPFDMQHAMDQMQTAYSTLIKREAPTQSGLTFDSIAKLANDGKAHPRIITLGGDHAIILPILRSLHEVYGEIAVVHFDSHLDTWPVLGYYGINDSSGIQDIEHDQDVGFSMITTDDIDQLGADGIAHKIREHVGDKPVYLSLDIDVIDPALAPATGTPEPGGWTTREVKRILRGLTGLNVIGADVVEVAPASETTALVAADIIHEMLSIMIGKEPAIVQRVDKKPGTRVEL